MLSRGRCYPQQRWDPALHKMHTIYRDKIVTILNYNLKSDEYF